MQSTAEKNYRRQTSGKISHVNRLEDNIVKMSITPKAIYRLNAISSKTLTILFAEIEKPTLKSIWNLQRPWIAKIIQRKNKARGLILPDFQTEYWTHWKTYRPMDRIESRNKLLQIHDQISLTRVARPFNGGKDRHFNKGVGKTGYPHTEEWGWTLPNTMYKNYLKWIHDLHLSPKTVRFLKENIGQKLYDFGFGNDFLDIIPKAQTRKGKK